jgi:signal transduction histidine kinase
VLIASRRPRSPIGWLLLAIALANAVYLPAGFIAMRGLLAGASPRGWVGWAAWVQNWTGGVGPLLLGFLVLFFPDGRLPGARWRWFAWFAALVAVVTTAISMLAPSPVSVSPRLPSLPNPIGIPALAGPSNNGPTFGTGPLGLLNGLLVVAVLAGLAAAVVVRLRRSTGLARRQLRWFAYLAAAALAVTVLGLTLVGSLAPSLGNAVASVAFGLGIGIAIPAAIGLAVVRDGLYDLDLFISRALVYGSLAAFITAVYVGIAVGVGALVGGGARPNLGLSILATAIVALGFQPVRERVQRVANRLVYGPRATPYEALSRFSGRVAEAYADDELLPRMARVLREGTGAEAAVVWLRAEGRLLPAAVWPDSPGDHRPLGLAGGGLPEIPASAHSVAVEDRGELLGALSVVKRRGESPTPMEVKLVDDLAHQAGLVLKNVGLTAELMRRLEELRVSRQRLVRAQDEERRRLERDLHDGAQQHLVAFKVKLGLVEALTARSPERATAMLGQLETDADDALETLRELAHGIYPPLLAERGLEAALRAQARRAAVPVEVAAEGVARQAPEVEATLYFCVLEALQNVQKYAGASRADVRLHEAGGELGFEVVDDGRGFDVAAAERGAGLANMADRLEALDGRLQVRSTAGRGTVVSGVVPTAPDTAG